MEPLPSSRSPAPAVTVAREAMAGRARMAAEVAMVATPVARAPMAATAARAARVATAMWAGPVETACQATPSIYHSQARRPACSPRSPPQRPMARVAAAARVVLPVSPAMAGREASTVPTDSVAREPPTAPRARRAATVPNRERPETSADEVAYSGSLCASGGKPPAGRT